MHRWPAFLSPPKKKITVVGERLWFRQQYLLARNMMRLTDIIEDSGVIEDQYDEFCDLRPRKHTPKTGGNTGHI
jgi:hypothetical protein